MAYGDFIQGARQSVNAYADRKARKNEGALSRLHDTLGRLGSQKYATEEREAGQEHEAFMEQSRQGAATSLAAAERDFALAENEQVAELQRETNTILMDHEEAMAKIRREFEVQLQAAGDTAAEERIKTQLANALEVEAERNKNELEANKQAWLQLFQEFPGEHEASITDPRTKEEYSATSMPEIEAILADMQARGIAAYRKDDDTSGYGAEGGVFDVAFGKLQATRPDLFPMDDYGNPGWYATVDQDTYDTLRNAFHKEVQSAVSDGYIDSEAVPRVMARFDDYVTGPGPETDAPGTDPALLSDLSALTAAMGELVAGLGGIGEREPRPERQPTITPIDWGQYPGLQPDPALTPGEQVAATTQEGSGMSNVFSEIIEPLDEEGEEVLAQNLDALVGVLEELGGRGGDVKDAERWAWGLRRPGAMATDQMMLLLQWMTELQGEPVE